MERWKCVLDPPVRLLWSVTSLHHSAASNIQEGHSQLFLLSSISQRSVNSSNDKLWLGSLFMKQQETERDWTAPNINTFTWNFCPLFIILTRRLFDWVDYCLWNTELMVLLCLPSIRIMIITKLNRRADCESLDISFFGERSKATK